MTLSICRTALNDTSLSYLYRTKRSTAPVSVAFVPCFLLCAGISFHAPALLIKAAWLLRVPLKSSPSLSDVLPLLNTLAFCCTDQRPARNSSKGIIQKKRKRRRGSRYKRCNSEQIRWLSNIGRKDKQRQTGCNEHKIGREYSDSWHNMYLISYIIV